MRAEETLSDVCLARLLGVGVWTHDGGKDMMFRDVDQWRWESQTFEDEMVVVNLDQRPGSKVT